MEHESFEDMEVAGILNKYYVPVKVDKEERPDVDSIYMTVCQAFTGSGGWPLTIIMTPDQKPFFAGTYFPKDSGYGSVGLVRLLSTVKEKWIENKSELIHSGNEVVNALKTDADRNNNKADSAESLINKAVEIFKKSFDDEFGGFGSAPKFPAPHNILFLLNHYEITKDKDTLFIAEKTLMQMHKGGIFDHIGFGFSRYSTDRFWLAPHFEKMLYDNALLTMAYLQAYEITKNELYKDVAVKTMDYVRRELTNEEGAFYCAQDADSDGIEGKYYVFTQNEIINLLGNTDGGNFNQYFDITREGNFEGKNIPNLIKNNELNDSMNGLIEIVYQYRKNRTQLHKDDKILTSWNSLMIVAYTRAYKILKNDKYLDSAKKADLFIKDNLLSNNGVFTSFRDGGRSANGFLDDYSFYIFAQLALYEATYDSVYLEKAIKLNNKLASDFLDTKNGGFYLYGNTVEQLILKPKETYDGAVPSGNSIMFYNLVKLSRLTKNAELFNLAKKHLDFMTGAAANYPAGYSFFMLSLQIYLFQTKEIVCVLSNTEDFEKIKSKFPDNTTVIILEKESKEYSLKDGKTTFYICDKNNCLPPTNVL